MHVHGDATEQVTQQSRRDVFEMKIKGRFYSRLWLVDVKRFIRDVVFFFSDVTYSSYSLERPYGKSPCEDILRIVISCYYIIPLIA